MIINTIIAKKGIVVLLNGFLLRDLFPTPGFQ
jgi:hypothetical protein